MGVQDQLQIVVRQEADRVIVALDGELDMATAEQLQHATDGLDGQTMVVLDLEQLQFIDSTGLRSVLSVLERCRDRGQEFAVTRGSQQVQRLLGVTGVGKHLRIIDAADEVLA
ncbi:MAG: STAS domain-containing protein [Solirubrobacteraceae bacterium]|jgi:anti-sigma B factor antagonist